MGISASKHTEKDQTDMQMHEDVADQTVGSIGSGSSIFQRLKSNRYERFSVNSIDKPQSLSMNNLEGDLTPRKTPNSGLKQRLIKALGGYNLLDPRSPSQIIIRSPLGFEKPKNTKEYMGKKTLVLDTSIDTNNKEEENPYSIFEENLDNVPIKEENDIITQNKSILVTEDLVDVFDGLVITKDPRSPSDGITRTPLIFAVGTLQTPSVEMQQSFVQEREEKTTVKSDSLETKLESTSTQLIKTIYKEIVRRDPIHMNLLNEDENDNDVGRTTPMKKSTTTSNRTPLSCVANRTRSRPIQPKNLLGNTFEDNFSPKIIPGDENTPIQVRANGRNIGRMTTGSVSKSKSKIPVVRSRRLH